MKKQITQLVDDLDGTVLDEGDGQTIRFALEGRTYEIDLTDANADKLRAAFAPFIAVARTVPATGRASGGSRRSRSSGGDLAAIRSWAQANGYSVGDRGRISADVREAYERAH